jgi:biopolymer transport protein ExbD
MARRKNRGAENTEVDMTPMIDMTFQLITFFMLTLNFSQAEQDERIQLPVSQLAKPAEDATDDPITLQLMRDGMVIYAGEPVLVRDMGGYLENEKRAMIAAGKEPNAATVIIRADGRSKTGEVQDLIKVCQEKGFDKFVFRAEHRP